MASLTSTPNASTTPPKTVIHDDKSAHCIPFILSLLSQATTSPTSPTKPFIIGLNGIQGSGKTTLVSLLSTTLRSPPYSLPTLVLSIDDLYLPHSALLTLSSAHPSNALIQHRGEPGTHDIPLATSIFQKLLAGDEVAVPAYDKSLFGGQGDRVPASQWKIVNRAGEPKIQVVILEGWCVGFRFLSSPALTAAYNAPSKTLHQHALADLQFVNSRLQEYDVMTDNLDAFIHIDAEDTEYVYVWRQEQEAALRREKGEEGGMSEEQVVRFVDGYYPAYELYTEALREGVFMDKGEEGRERQLRLVVGKDRRVKEVIKI